MPTPIRTITLILAFLAVGFYWFLFLSQPLVEGAQLSRGLFVLSNIVYPEGYLLASWTGDGRLPLAFLDRIPLAVGTLAWLGLAGLIGWPWCVVVKASRNQWSTWLMQASLACLAGLAICQRSRCSWAWLGYYSQFGH